MQQELIGFLVTAEKLMSLRQTNLPHLQSLIEKIAKLPEVESSRTSLASRTFSRTHFEVLALASKPQILGLGLEALGPRKLACPRLEDSTIF